MNSWPKIINWVLLAGLLCFGCEKSPYESYYQKTSTDWQSYLSEISGEEISSVENTVLLVLKSSECNPALTELKRWNQFHRESETPEVKLIILERYASTFNTFLDFENITIPAYRDSSALVLEHKLLPTTPLKVYINKKGEVAKLETVGTGGPVSFLGDD